MSYNAVPVEWLLEEARNKGIYTQLELDIPRHYIIDEEFLSSCVVAFYHLNGKGQKTGSHGSVDHPAFTALREHLGATGRIKIQRNWWNGDRVIIPFYLNDRFFGEGDQFSSASALGNSFISEKKRLNKNNENSNVSRESSEEERAI